MTEPLIRMQGITKSFAGVIANQDVDLEIRAGEIHALLGENGAGKSTLMNVLTGIYRPDAGGIRIEGRPCPLAGPRDAIAAGIGMVHQHFSLVRSFTVAENIHLGWDRTPRIIRRRALAARTGELAGSLGLSVRPDARIDELSIGEQQRVEIIRVLARGARTLILDEPTAVLTPTEAQELFRTLKAFVARGNAVIFISHKLEEVLAHCARITVLRRGRRVATELARDCSAGQLAQLMLGAQTSWTARPESGSAAGAPASAVPVLSLRDATVTDPRGRALLDRVSLDLHGGEILGIAGVTGNGQSELSQLLTGLRRPSAGQVFLGGQDVTASGGSGFAGFGVGHIPEDRLHSGLAPELSITDNSVMREYRRAPIARGAWYGPGRARRSAESIAAAAAVRVVDFTMPVSNLSGGNQQRLVARREVRIAGRVLVAAYATRGLDIGAIGDVMRCFAELRAAGVGVIMISEDLDELVGICDRIAVLFRGAITGVVSTASASVAQIGLLMTGDRGPPAASAGRRG